MFFSSKCSLFHNANLFGSCIIHILYTGCAEIKKKIFRRQRVNVTSYHSYFHVQTFSLRQSQTTCPYYKPNNDSYVNKFIIYRLFLIMWLVIMGYIQVLSNNFHRKTEQNHEKSHSILPASLPSVNTEWPKKMYTLFTHQYLWNKFK